MTTTGSKETDRTATIKADDPSRSGLNVRRRWPDWAAYAAAGWAFVYGVAALIWTVIGRGFPFGADDSGREAAVLRNLAPSVGAPVFAAVFLTATVVMLVMASPGASKPARIPRVLLLGFGWTLSAALLFVLPDVRVLTTLGYAPLLLIGAPFGWPPQVDYSEVFTWSLLNQGFVVLGGALIVAAVLAWQRRTAMACARCGRREQGRTWTTPEAAARWGRWAVGVATAVPALYAVSRIAWLLDIPVFVDEEFLAELRVDNGHLAGAGLAAFALVGVVLTLGLVQRWGEVFPRWMVGVRGKRVPVRLAVVPAALVAAAVASASISLLSMPKTRNMITDGDPLVAPMLLWPAWAVALGAATLAYYLRRRSVCAQCGRDS